VSDWEALMPMQMRIRYAVSILFIALAFWLGLSN
jgi:hypothetical protein